jgi:Uma2 family endonuclease
MTASQHIVDQIMAHTDAYRIVEQARLRLLAEEDRRRAFYDIVTEDDKAEFVNGEIVFHSPVMKAHNDATKYLLNLLLNYVEYHNLGYVGVEKIMTRFTRNDYEPDICFFNSEQAATFEDKQLLFPVPDFVVEVLSKSSAKTIEHDTVTKYHDYEQHGVREYWIVDPHEQTVAQYALEDGRYQLIPAAADGLIKGIAIPGFNIPVKAIFDRTLNQELIRKLMTEGEL